MGQRRAFLPCGSGSSRWQTRFSLGGGSLISWLGMATSASYVPGSAMATNTPAPGWLICCQRHPKTDHLTARRAVVSIQLPSTICWLSQRHEHAAVAGGRSPVSPYECQPGTVRARDRASWTLAASVHQADIDHGTWLNRQATRTRTRLCWNSPFGSGPLETRRTEFSVELTLLSSGDARQGSAGRMTLNSPPPLCECLRIAVIAALLHLRAPDHRIPGCPGRPVVTPCPFDLRRRAHAKPSMGGTDYRSTYSLSHLLLPHGSD